MIWRATYYQPSFQSKNLSFLWSFPLMMFVKEKRWLYAFIQIKTLLGFVALWILKCEPLSNGSKLIFTLVSDKSCTQNVNFWKILPKQREDEVFPLRNLWFTPRLEKSELFICAPIVYLLLHTSVYTFKLPIFFFNHIFLTLKSRNNVRTDGCGKIVTECNLVVCNLNILNILDLSNGNIEYFCNRRWCSTMWE